MSASPAPRRSGVPSAGGQAELVRSLKTAHRRTAAQADALARDLDQIFEAAELVATDDEHDPEGTTIAYERAQVTALLAQARVDLEALDQALVDVREVGHVRCQGCGQPIALERLLALPTARTCIRCAAR
jgi:RNA polymerase-binding transcription factor